MMCRDSHQTASEALSISDEVLAMEFNLSVTLRLCRYDNEKDEANRKFWMALVGGTGETPDSEALLV